MQNLSPQDANCPGSILIVLPEEQSPTGPLQTAPSRPLASGSGQQRDPRRRVKARPSRKWWFLLVVLLLVAAPICHFSLPVIGQYQNLAAKADRLLAHEYHLLRSSNYTIKPGTDLDAAHLLERLHNLGYRLRVDRRVEPGEYSVEGRFLYLHTRPFAGQPGHKATIGLKGSVVQTMADEESGKQLEEIPLSPLVLTSFTNRVWEIRTPVDYKDLPIDLINAVLTTEDRGFFHHPGINFKAIVRAAVVNFKAGRVLQGGSTISQQTVKVLIGRENRNLREKYYEALLSLALESRYSKEEILTLYLNNVYLGRISNFEIRGMAAAAETLLAKKLADLDLDECALLAGLIRSPNSASPVRNPGKAAKRTRTVLAQLAATGNHQADPDRVGDRMGSDLFLFRREPMSYYLAQVEKELNALRLDLDLNQSPLVIDLGLDPWMQNEASKTLENELAMRDNELQGAIVIMNPVDGSVLAAVGGRHFADSQFNRAFDAKRQIGSLVKPFVYLTALGGTGLSGHLTQASLVDDAPYTVHYANQQWSPENYDKKFLGIMTVRRALSQSRNVLAVKVGISAGLDNIVTLLRETGLNPQTPDLPATLLGAVTSTPALVASSYSTLANGGQVVTPAVIKKVSRDNEILFQATPPRPLLIPGPCYVITDILQSVLTEGTGRNAEKFGFTGTAAGKTGTTSDLRDAWFAGYTPSMVAVVWVGRDDNRRTGLTGSSGSLPIWSRTMAALTGGGDSKFSVPEGIAFAEIDPESGELSLANCQEKTREAFIDGSVPTSSCSLHPSMLAAIRNDLRQVLKNKLENLGVASAQLGHNANNDETTGIKEQFNGWLDIQRRRLIDYLAR